FPYINEPTKANLIQGTPDKYFVYEKGANLVERIRQVPDAGGIGKDFLGSIIAECFRRYATTQTSVILDKIKELGFSYSTRAGISIAIADIVVPKEKEQLLRESEEKVNIAQHQYRRGLITDEERYDRVISFWDKMKREITEVLMKSLDKFNSLN